MASAVGCTLDWNDTLAANADDSITAKNKEQGRLRQLKEGVLLQLNRQIEASLRTVRIGLPKCLVVGDLGEAAIEARLLQVRCLDCRLVFR